ncbi:hypothetical protein [Nostoc sp.]|uniref:hypothetical protein n=1 Tax=Nostoc sp. TaxID=1180 RepID=UPI002FFB25F4
MNQSIGYKVVFGGTADSTSAILGWQTTSVPKNNSSNFAVRANFGERFSSCDFIGGSIQF